MPKPKCDYQEIKTAEHLQEVLHEKPVYDSVLKSCGSPDEVESFFTRIVSLFRTGILRARYFPNETEGRVRLKSKYPSKSAIALFKEEENLGLLPLSARGKKVICWAHPDPANSDLNIINFSPWHQDPANIDLLCKGRPMFDSETYEEHPEGLFKYLEERASAER